MKRNLNLFGGHKKIRFLLMQAQDGLNKGATALELEHAIMALRYLGARPEDDAIFDKWLYQAIGCAAEIESMYLSALELADTLEKRLKRRTDAESLAAIALWAGASVNAVRLELHGVLVAPNPNSGDALATRGARCALAIDRLVRAMVRDQRKVWSISPKRYVDSLRVMLSKGALALESASPTLADVAWTCRRAALEALVVIAPEDIDIAASDALRGLSTHARFYPTGATFRSQCYVSLEKILKPWHATPYIICEWFLRQAVVLDTADEEIDARASRCKGRLHVGRHWPLYCGILCCGDIKVERNPSWSLTTVARCFRVALEDNAFYAAVVWRRAWVALAAATASFRRSRDWTVRGYSPAEAALLSLGDVAIYCRQNEGTDAHRANAYWHAAIVAARRGAIQDAVGRCDVAEKKSSSARSAEGFKRVGLAALQRATNIKELTITAAILQRAVRLPESSSESWIALSDCFVRLKRLKDAAAAATEAACRCLDVELVREAVIHYSRAVMHMQKAPFSLLIALERAKAPFAGDMLRERFRACEAGSSTSAIITAAEEFSVWYEMSSAFAISRAGSALTLRGAYSAGTVLSQYGLKAACYDMAASATAWSSLFLAHSMTSRINYADETFNIYSSDVSALAGLQGIEKVHPTIDPLITTTIALQSTFLAAKNIAGLFPSYAMLAFLAPRLQDSALALLIATLARVGFTQLPRAVEPPLRINCVSLCAGFNLVTSETRHYTLFSRAETGGCNRNSDLSIGLDEARARVQQAAVAEMGIEIFDDSTRHGNVADATHAVSMFMYPKSPPWHRNQGILLYDFSQASHSTKGKIWLRLSKLWLRRGFSARAEKYARRMASSTQASAATKQAATALDMLLSLWMRNWPRAVVAINSLGNHATAHYPSCIRRVEEALCEGDLLRRQGKFEDAIICYASAKNLLVDIECFVLESRISTLKAAPENCRCVVLARYYQPLLGRMARVVDLQQCSSQEHQEKTYRAALRAPLSNMLECACIRYRLGRKLLDKAFATVGAASEALHQLRRAFLLASRVNHWKLAKNSARALIVAALHFLPGAMSSPVVALLAHVSVGHMPPITTKTALSASPSKVSEQVDNLLANLLCGADGMTGCRDANDASALDTRSTAMAALNKILAPLPKSYVVAATFITPTGHLVIARVQRDRAPITLCTALPRGWRGDPTSAVSRCRSVLNASSFGLGNAPFYVASKDDAKCAKQRWWCQRHALDAALKASIDFFDKTWIGALRVLLGTTPTLSDSIGMSPISLSSTGHTEMRRLCANAAPYLSNAEFEALFRAVPRGAVNMTSLDTRDSLFGGDQAFKVLSMWIQAITSLSVADLKAALTMLGLCSVGLKNGLSRRLCQVLRSAASVLGQNVKRTSRWTVGREPLLLALDDRLQYLPIEHLDITHSAPISRVPSLAFALFLAAQMRFGKCNATNGIRMQACCVIDPEANLPSTRHRVKSYLRNRDSQICVDWFCAALGAAPTAQTTARVATTMSTCAVYLFCGHNHGATYLESVVESNFMSAMLLMGCSSGALSNEGDSVSRGVAIELLARGVPTVVAMLWDVTDRDVDCVTLELVQLLAKNPTCPIPDQLCTAKKAARLLALNGAATVCYGLPVSLAEIESSRRIIQTWQV